MFKQRLKELRLEKKISQAELASELNISNRTISMYEQGKSEPNIEILLKIAKYFHVTSDYLIGLSDKKNADFEIIYMSRQLGLSERSIEELLMYSQIANSQEGEMQKHITNKLDVLNLLLSCQCDLLDKTTTYLHFSATHFKNFYDNENITFAPISELELWDDLEQVSYSEDWDMWSRALLLAIEDELKSLRDRYLQQRATMDTEEDVT